MPSGFMYQGYPLSNWIRTQRQVYQGRAAGILDDERKAKLEAIGMRWDSLVDINFNRYYEAAKHYFKEHGDLNVPAAYIDDNGIKLDEWIYYLRESKRRERNTLLTAEQNSFSILSG